MSTQSRRGFTWIELVVVLFVLAVLAALILPSISSARGPARRTQCLNNMRNVGLALQNYSTQHSGAFPPLEGGRHAWPVSILRVLDQPIVARDIESGTWRDEDAPHLQVYTCPEDADSFQTPGGLSYVVNGGYGFFPIDGRTGAVTEQGTHSLAQDWDGDGEVSEQDRLVTRATGVVWRPDEVIEPLTLDEIGTDDGTGSTLLLTENLHAGPWTSRETRALAFVVGRERLTFGGAGPLDVAKADLGPFAINGGKEAEGLVPAPSSNHSTSVNVIFADGRGGSLSEAINPLVYVRILTPQGRSYGERAVDDADVD